MEIKAIPTVYKGYKFRSRLEARWAVFFDAMQIEWEYEKEGFVLDKMAEKGDDGVVYDSTLFYLPDFYLPKEDIWVEVKPCQLTESEGEKFQRFARAYSIVAAIGLPEPKEYSALSWFDPDSGFMQRCIQYGLAQDIFDEYGITVEDLPGFLSWPYVFGENRKAQYLWKALFKSTSKTGSLNRKFLTSQCNRLPYKHHHALRLACNVAKQARFEYGEG